MSVLKYQSDDELIRVMDEWVRFNCPPNVVKNSPNINKIGDHCVAKYGFVSIHGLTEAAHELGAANLELIPEPKKLTVEEQAKIFQEREFKRIEREKLENAVPFDERIKAETEKKNRENAAKAQLDAKGQLEVAIDGYQCYRKNGSGVDHPTTDLMKAELRGVKVGDGKDFIRTLTAVRQIIHELPDHPEIGDVARVVEKLNARSKANKEAAATVPRVQGIW
jgi:hypothetical protein